MWHPLETDHNFDKRPSDYDVCFCGWCFVRHALVKETVKYRDESNPDFDMKITHWDQSQLQ